MASYRFRKNKIRMLCHDGAEVFDDHSKMQIATDYYKKIFEEKRNWAPNINLSHLYTANTQALQSLGTPFTWEEIAKAIKGAPAGRSPGPDGFTNEFYKKICRGL